MTLSASQLRANKAYTGGFISSHLGDESTSFEPVEIAMGEKEEARLRNDLLRRRKDDDGGVTLLRRVSQAPGSKRVLLVTKIQARLLNDAQYSTIPLSAKELKANKAHTDGFIVSLLGDAVAGQVDETTDDAIDDETVDDRLYEALFVRRNNQLARVKEYKGEEGRGLILVKPTESDRNVVDRAAPHTADGLFLACKDNSFFALSECENDHLFKILS